jgi:guanylate kinase
MSADTSPKGIVFVISGPSGVGKSSILRRVLERDRGLAFSVSHTTRPPRQGERDGVDYRFVDEDRFRSMIDADAFLEWAEYQGRLYGTSRDAVEEPTSRGVDLILEVEVQGAEQLRKRLPQAVTVFVLPPSSMQTLERRLVGRKSDDEQAIRKRLETAKREITEARHYEYLIVNDELECAATDLAHLIASARLARERVLPAWRARFELDSEDPGA